MQCFFLSFKTKLKNCQLRVSIFFIVNDGKATIKVREGEFLSFEVPVVLQNVNKVPDGLLSWRESIFWKNVKREKCRIFPCKAIRWLPWRSNDVKFDFLNGNPYFLWLIRKEWKLYVRYNLDYDLDLVYCVEFNF